MFQVPICVEEIGTRNSHAAIAWKFKPCGGSIGFGPKSLSKLLDPSRTSWVSSSSSFYTTPSSFHVFMMFPWTLLSTFIYQHLSTVINSCPCYLSAKPATSLCSSQLHPAPIPSIWSHQGDFVHIRSGAKATSATCPCGVCGFFSSRRTRTLQYWSCSRTRPRPQIRCTCTKPQRWIKLSNEVILRKKRQMEYWILTTLRSLSLNIATAASWNCLQSLLHWRC